MYSSSFEYVGATRDDADYVYYNADIINNRTSDQTLGVVQPDPIIKFNESRDAPIIKDASKYHGSIIRFQINGPNRNLPLLIPEIQENQPNVNLTIYSCAITYTQSWNTSLGLKTFNIAPQPYFMVYAPETINSTLAPTPNSPVVKQDLNTLYYYVFTYSHMVDLMNATLLSAHDRLYQDFQTAWTAAGLSAPNDPFPYPTLESFAAAVNAPQISYSETTGLFTLYADSDGYGDRLEPFTPQPYSPPVAYNPVTAYNIGDVVVYLGTAYRSLQNANTGNTPSSSPTFWSATTLVGPATKPTCRLFFNSNMYELFANFLNNYYNSTSIAGLPSPLPVGYVYEIVFRNNFYQNIIDYRLAPYGGVSPLGYVPTYKQKVFWTATQNWVSTDFWTPITSIVFTSTLIPFRAEQTGVPLIIGESNALDTTATSAAAFQPIITDIAVDVSSGSQNYRTSVIYNPTAEYRLFDFGPSKQEIRNIDIQVFWKCKLNNQLYPITIPNGGTVSFKLMFRRRDIA